MVSCLVGTVGARLEVAASVAVVLRGVAERESGMERGVPSVEAIEAGGDIVP